MSSANSGNVSSYSDIEILPSYFSWSTITHPWIQSLHNYLWWWDTRCPRVSRWTGGTQSAPDSWGTGSPPAPDQSPERLHLSNWKRSPPAGTRERRSKWSRDRSVRWPALLRVGSYLQHAGAVGLDGALRCDVQLRHRLLTATTKKQGKSYWRFVQMCAYITLSFITRISYMMQSDFILDFW